MRNPGCYSKSLLTLTAKRSGFANPIAFGENNIRTRIKNVLNYKKPTLVKGDRKMSGKTNCEYCMNYIYDEEYGYYECEINLDEDDLSRFLGNTLDNCPSFQFNDEYKIVRKQM